MRTNAQLALPTRIVAGLLLAACTPATSTPAPPPAHGPASAVASSPAPPPRDDAPRASVALPSTPPPPTDRAYENALEQADGPFASLRAYCAWYTRDCVRGDARLCICKVHPGPFADIATVETRDTGRGSDAVSHVAAFRTPAGWRVSRRGVEAHDGAETSQGASRASVRFDHHEMRDVLGDATPERLFWFTQAKEHSPPGVGGWSVYSRTDAFIACVDASPPRCTEPLDARTIYPAYPRDAGVSGMPTLRKDAHGRLVIDDPTSGEPPMVYEFREKDEAAD